MKILPVNNITPKIKPVVRCTSETILSMANKQMEYSEKPSVGFWTKLKNIFKPKKETPNNRVFELEKFINNPVLVEEFFKAYPDLDLNAKDKNGLTLLLRAVDRSDEFFIYHLAGISREYGKEIDWNVTDKDGNNAAMRNINKKGASGLQGVLLDRLNLDYINPKTKRTFFQEAIVKNHEGYIMTIINRSYDYSDRFDINHTHPDTPPAFFLALSHNVKSYYVEKMLKEFNVDLDAEYKGKTIFEYVDIKKCKNLSSKSLDILETHLLKKDLKKMKEYYDKEGFVDLDQILEYIKLPNFSKICNEPLNAIDENIGHFVAEIVPKNFEEIKKISNIVNILAESGYDFNGVDGIDRTAITKAIEADNLVVFKLLYQKLSMLGQLHRANSFGIAKKYADELKKNNITNPEWYKFINQLI